MAALPYMQLYVAEYLADTSHLSAAQHGAYLLLLMNYWQRGKALPDSNDRLAIVARMSNEEWTANRHVLMEFFEIVDNQWIHHRVERDLLKVKGISEAGRTAGLASAEARKQRASNDRSTTVEKSFNENPTIKNRTDKNKKEKTKDISRSDEAERVYAEYPSKVGRKVAVEAIEKAIKKLEPTQECPADYLIERIRGWIASRDRDRAKGTFVPPYPNPATWFNQERYDDPANEPVKNCVLPDSTLGTEDQLALTGWTVMRGGE